jgi:hypothetical protein
LRSSAADALSCVEQREQHVLGRQLLVVRGSASSCAACSASCALMVSLSSLILGSR